MESPQTLLFLEIDEAFDGKLTESQIENAIQQNDEDDSLIHSLEQIISSNLNDSYLDPSNQTILEEYCTSDKTLSKVITKNKLNMNHFVIDLHTFSRHQAKEIVIRSLKNAPTTSPSRFTFVVGKGRHTTARKQFKMRDYVIEALHQFGIKDYGITFDEKNQGRIEITLVPVTTESTKIEFQYQYN